MGHVPLGDLLRGSLLALLCGLPFGSICVVWCLYFLRSLFFFACTPAVCLAARFALFGACAFFAAGLWRLPPVVCLLARFVQFGAFASFVVRFGACLLVVCFVARLMPFGDCICFVVRLWCLRACIFA